MTDYSSSAKNRQTIQLAPNTEFVIKDHRGFTILQVTEAGDVKVKGKSVKV